MTLAKLLEELFKRDITFRISGEQLRHRDPRRLLTPELKARLEQYSPTIISYLRDAEGESPPVYPLSSAQQRLWFLYQLIPYSPPTHNFKFEARLLSKPHIPALQRALNLLVERHAALRTTYISLHGAPVQRIHNKMDAEFEIFDATDCGREQIGETMGEVSARPLDLAHGPILRAYLFILPRGRGIFRLLLPQIAADFRSLELLVEELSQLYIEGKTGVAAALEPVSQQYIDYVSWKLRMLDSDEGKAHRAYLSHLLAGELPVLNLPADRPRPPAQTYHTSSFFLTMTATLSRQVKKMANAENTSLYTILISAFFVLLHRYTGQEDILIGSPRSDQGHRHFKGVVGYFDNPVPLTGRSVRKSHLSRFSSQNAPGDLGGLRSRRLSFPSPDEPTAHRTGRQPSSAFSGDLHASGTAPAP